MDIGAGIAQGSDLMRSGASFNADQMRVKEELNRKATTDYNNTISNAKMKADAFKSGFDVYDKGSAVGGAVNTALTGAKVYSDAVNFDSEVAGFGRKGVFSQSGKGADAFLASQGQIAKGRFGQAKATLRRAVGYDDADSAPQSAGELGLSREKFVGTEDQASQMGSRVRNINDPAPTTIERPQTRMNRIFGGESTGLGTNTGAITGSRSNYTSGLETTMESSSEGADAGKIAGGGKDATDAQRAVAKASGGLFTAEAGADAESGMAGGVVRKLGKFVSDMPEGQLGAVADVVGKGAGFIGAGKSIYEDLSGERKDMTGAQKVANTADIISGGIDALSIAMPALAPIGAVAGIASSLLDIGSEADGDTEAQKKAKASAGATLSTQQGKNQQAMTQVASLGSAGQIAKTQISAY